MRLGGKRVLVTAAASGIGRGLAQVALKDAWAAREIRLVARDFSTLPVAARALVQHLQAPAAERLAA